MADLQDAISLLERGDARAASVLLEAMAEEMPGYATARVLLARAYEGLGEWSGALDAWREAVQIVPNSPVIRRGLERAARNAASHAGVEESPELPTLSVGIPTGGAAEVDEMEVDETEVERDGVERVDVEAPEETEPDGDALDAAPVPDDGELDRLIAELESARIVPRPDLDNLPEPALEDDIEDVVSVTLARIYASQAQYDEAARVYELLATQQPENEDEFLAKAAEMRSKASDD